MCVPFVDGRLERDIKNLWVRQKIRSKITYILFYCNSRNWWNDIQITYNTKFNSSIWPKMGLEVLKIWISIRNLCFVYRRKFYHNQILYYIWTHVFDKMINLILHWHYITCYILISTSPIVKIIANLLLAIWESVILQQLLYDTIS